MHPSALNFGKLFFETYCANLDGAVVYDVGAQNVNGSLRDVCLPHLGYVGVDFVEGNGVDIVLDDPYKLPFADSSLDVIVCSSCFEHSQFFWLVFLEMIRVLKPQGLLYLNVPSNGSFHRYPVDCWRFYPDAGRALEALAGREGYPTRLLESFVGGRSADSVESGGAWHDFVAVFVKDRQFESLFNARIVDRLNDYSNGYSSMSSEELRPEFLSPDHVTITGLEKALATRDEECLELTAMLEARDKVQAELQVALETRDKALAELQVALDARDEKVSLQARRIAELTETLEGVLTSESWRLTRPVRWVGGVLRKPVRATRAVRQAIGYYGSVDLVLQKSLRVLRHEGLAGLRSRAKVLSDVCEASQGSGLTPSSADGLYGALPAVDAEFQPKVSVIVPNFNHAPYLRERLDSIYRQTYKNFEVILLDDCSTDQSREILTEYAVRHKDITMTAFNDANSGGVFNQWKKGLSLAKGDLVWIAESDDYCDDNHLAELVRFFRNDAVMLAFSRTDFVRGGEKVWTSEEFLSDTRLDVWGHPFIKSAHWLVGQAWGMKNVVPNVSSAVFRHPGDMPLLDDDSWRSLRLCGDWIFYLHLVRGGLVAYSPQTTNYYRQHEQGTSINTQKQATYYREHEVVAKVLLELYRVDERILERQRQALYMHWCLSRGSAAEREFEALYDLGRARAAARPRKPNVLMVGFALAAGGGETFPIMLANQLKRQGVGVSFLNCRRAVTEPGIRKMLDRSVPLFELGGIQQVGLLCEDLGVELVHSHHAWVDMTLAQCLLRHPSVKQVITLHGMYEMMTADALANFVPLMERRIDRVVYTAEKNLGAFADDFRARKGFVRINNALEFKEVRPIDRNVLGIGPDDFVLCLVSRAIPEKGWDEAIQAVLLAQRDCPRKIHLVLIGEGEEFDRLKDAHASDSIHFLGFRANIRDYFAMADMGFLPSRFRGESFPLVLIDCLFAGRPMLASRIGEIPLMLEGADGPAGELFDLQDFSIPVRDVASLVVRLATDRLHYETLKSRVLHAAEKFDPSVMTQKYQDVYHSVLEAH